MKLHHTRRLIAIKRNTICGRDYVGLNLSSALNNILFPVIVLFSFFMMFVFYKIRPKRVNPAIES